MYMILQHHEDNLWSFIPNNDVREWEENFSYHSKSKQEASPNNYYIFYDTLFNDDVHSFDIFILQVLILIHTITHFSFRIFVGDNTNYVSNS